MRAGPELHPITDLNHGIFLDCPQIDAVRAMPRPALACRRSQCTPCHPFNRDRNANLLGLKDQYTCKNIAIFLFDISLELRLSRYSHARPQLLGTRALAVSQSRPINRAITKRGAASLLAQMTKLTRASNKVFQLALPPSTVLPNRPSDH